jgi:hypothetical protein
MTRYDVGTISRLAELVGFNNVGVKYRPDWTSKAAAEAWVLNEQEKARKSNDQKRIEFAAKWGVQAADLDNDPRTPDNVILFSDQAQRKIKAIDGHYLIPHERKELDRSFYTALPTRAERVATDTQLKKTLKQWYRKNPTLELQRKSPFATFVPEVSAFQYVRNTFTNYSYTLELCY